ncbi:MAG: 30S ribosomal protein S9 [Nanoarchaeota archaeon]
MNPVEKIITSGKRKRAIAKASIVSGSGKVKINNQDYKNLQLFDKLKIEEPLRIAEHVLGKMNFDINVKMKSGGEKSQIEAARLAIAKAIVKFTNSEELTNAFLSYDRNLLVADIRRKETYKPGDSKARRKRQKSYR